MTDDLLVWLRGQLDEDERLAREATPSPWRWVNPGGKTKLALVNGDWRPPHLGGWDTVLRLAGEHLSKFDAEHIVRWDPSRVLREVEAKRRILELHAGDHECSTIRRGTDQDGNAYEDIDSCTWVTGTCSTVRLLAAPLSDRPGYRQEWAP